MLAAAFSGIQVGLRPLFRHPGVYGTPLSGSRWVCGPSFGILVVSAPPPPGSWCFRAPPFGILVGYFVAAFCFVRCTCVRCIQISRCFPWLQADHCRLIMPRPPKGGAAAEAAAEVTNDREALKTINPL